MPSNKTLLIISIVIVTIIVLFIIGYFIWKWLTPDPIRYGINSEHKCVVNPDGSFKDDSKCGFVAGDIAYDFVDGVCTALPAGSVSKYKNDKTCGKGNEPPPDDGNGGNNPPPDNGGGNNPPPPDDAFCGHKQVSPNPNGYTQSILLPGNDQLLFERAQAALDSGNKLMIEIRKENNSYIAIRTDVSGGDGNVPFNGTLCDNICVRLVGEGYKKNFNTLWNVYPGTDVQNFASKPVLLESATRPGYFLTYAQFDQGTQRQILTANYVDYSGTPSGFPNNYNFGFLNAHAGLPDAQDSYFYIAVDTYSLKGQINGTGQCGTVQQVQPVNNSTLTKSDKFVVYFTNPK